MPSLCCALYTSHCPCPRHLPIPSSPLNKLQYILIEGTSTQYALLQLIQTEQQRAKYDCTDRTRRTSYFVRGVTCCTRSLQPKQPQPAFERTPRVDGTNLARSPYRPPALLKINIIYILYIYIQVSMSANSCELPVLYFEECPPRMRPNRPIASPRLASSCPFLFIFASSLVVSCPYL